MEEERTLVKSKRHSLMPFNLTVLAIGAVATLVLSIVGSAGRGIDEFLRLLPIFIGIILGSILIILAIINGVFKLSNYSIKVTDKAIYGRIFMGKEVTLPLDSVSAVGKILFKGVVVATSSGKVQFRLIKNVDEVYSTINKLIRSRQTKNSPQATTSNADELKKYKELFDSGVITQEEFDAKKKQILGL